MDWPPGWRDVGKGEGLGLQVQIRRELSEGHILFGRTFNVIARRDDSDDLLIEMDDGEVAEMHLAWLGVKESNPSFAGALLYVDRNHWREAQF